MRIIITGLGLIMAAFAAAPITASAAPVGETFPASGQFSCPPTGYWPVQNKASHYVIGNCHNGGFNRNAISGTDVQLRSFSGGYVGGGFGACGWVIRSDNGSSPGPPSVSPTATFSTCGGSSPTSSPELRRPVPEFARMVNCQGSEIVPVGECGDGTYAGRTTTSCTIWANVRPWASSEAPSGAMRQLPSGYGQLRWRYVTKSGAHVLVRDTQFPRNSTAGAWGFVPRGCLPAQLYIQRDPTGAGDLPDNVWCVAGNCSGQWTTTLPTYPTPELDTDGDGTFDGIDDCPSQAGPTSTRGCPDVDGDGIGSQADVCPDEPGPAPDGCPPAKPALTVAGDGTQAVYFRGSDQQIWQWQWDSGDRQWHLTPLGGSAAGDPTAFITADGSQAVYYRGTDGAIWQRQWDSGDRQWHLTRLGGAAAGDPTGYVSPDGTQAVYFRGSDGRIWQWQWDSGDRQWHLTPLGGSAAGDPAAQRLTDGTQVVYFRGNDGAVWHLQWEVSSHQWHLTRLGGSATGDVAVGRGPDGTSQFVYFRGADGAIWQWQWGTWDYTWRLTRLGGSAAGSPTAFLAPDWTQMAYFRGTDGAVWQWQWGTWDYTWRLTRLGGQAAGDPAGLRLADDTQLIYFRSSDRGMTQWQWGTWDRIWHLTPLGGQGM